MLESRRSGRVGRRADVQHDHERTALATGTPGYARFKTAQNGTASTVIIELDAGVGSGSLNFSSTIALGGTVSITSATITEGND